jgi:protein Mpv17
VFDLSIGSADNAQLIPAHLRVLAVNGVNIPWNAFLSLQAAKGKGETTKIEVDETVHGGVEKKLRV